MAESKQTMCFVGRPSADSGRIERFAAKKSKTYRNQWLSSQREGAIELNGGKPVPLLLPADGSSSAVQGPVRMSDSLQSPRRIAHCAFVLLHLHFTTQEKSRNCQSVPPHSVAFRRPAAFNWQKSRPSQRTAGFT